MRQAWLRAWAVGVVAAAATACPGGVLYDRGNAFPCDFAQTEVSGDGRLQRDLACPSGWVCGVANRCQRNEPGDLLDCEGACIEPQMIGGQILPKNSGPIQALALGAESVAALEEGGDWYELSAPAPDGGTRTALVLPAENAARTAQAAVHRGAVVWEADGRVYRAQKAPDSAALTSSGAPITNVASPLRTSDSRLELAFTGGGDLFIAQTADPATETSSIASNTIYDVGTVNPALFGDPAGGERALAITQTGFWYLDDASAWQKVSTEAPPSAALRALKKGPKGTSWALTAGAGSVLVRPDGSTQTLTGGAPTLSSWALVGAPNSTQLVRTWADCSPCVTNDARGLDTGHIVAAVPQGSGPIEVMCARAVPFEGDPSPFFFRRVNGVNPTVPDVCATTPFLPGFDPAQIHLPAVFNGPDQPVRPAADVSLGVAFGGKNGQVWAGPTLSAVRPIVLDRVPTEVVDTPIGVVAMTEQFFALSAALEGPRRGDFFTGPGSVSSLKAITGAPFGLIAVSGTGEVLFIKGDRVRFGPQLLNPRGEAARGPYAISETAVENLYVITADDGLYLYEANVESAREVPGEVPGVFPVFTPEPNFPLRGVAIDRSAQTDNFLVRGFTSTARSVFLFEVEDAPRVSRVVPLLEGVGEPLEVWMRSAQPVYSTARVGFRDGQIFTLPAGLPYANALPEGERVRDFAPLGPWPFALSESGVLYRGKLEREGRPLVWVREKYPDGSEPWLGQRGKLFVSFPPPGTRPFEYALYVFADHGAVYKAASYVE